MVVKGFLTGDEGIVFRGFPAFSFVIYPAGGVVFIEIIAPVDIVLNFIFDRHFFGGGPVVDDRFGRFQ